MELFRGYVPTRNKQCLEKFKGVEKLKTRSEVQDLDEYAGILGEETILIDVDDAETSELLFRIVQDLELKCRVYATTRGKHFLFKNCGVKKSWTKCTLAVGITTDGKVGANNSYEILKSGGVERPILYDFPEGEIQELPKWLTPVKSNYDFPNLGEGDGRNQTLFNYILTLQSDDFTKEEARECIRLINRYVLKKPLSDKELDVILRDDAFKKTSFFRDKTFLFDKFATYLKNNNHIVKINNQLHIYKDGIYVSGAGEIEGAMIKLISNLKRAWRSEVLSYLEIMIEENTKATNPNIIAFSNGLYNIRDGSFKEFTPDVVITNKIPWPYNPAAHDDLLDHTLNRLACDDPEVRALLEEMVGYCMYRRNELGKAFILIGDKSNGKSTFLHVVKNLLGDQNIASLDLKELGDRFKTAELFGKLANIGDDTNWCGHPFAQANWYAFGRLAWKHSFSSEQIGEEWLKQTFLPVTGAQTDTPAGEVIQKEQIDAQLSLLNSQVLQKSREAVVDYMMPLGLHHIFAWGHHYGPEPWCDIPDARPDWLPPYYHRADNMGIGFDRSSTGSNATGQYHSPLCEQLDNVNTCPENLLLWFHHVPWNHQMKSGRTLWAELCCAYDRGVNEVRNFQKVWDRMEPYIDSERFRDVQHRLKIQARDAVWWRDACLLYFQQFSRQPIPYELERPIHELKDMMEYKLDITNFECPPYGFSK